MRVLVSCAGKFHAFALAEQLQKHGMLAGFYTSYAWQKNTLMRRFVRRTDREDIDARHIHTHIPIAVLIKTLRLDFVCNNLFDTWVSRNIARRNDYEVFIGWSGMSLKSIGAAKQRDKTTILERGSSHIVYQNKTLKEEYARFGLEFTIDPRVIDKELQEYEVCDFISVPSNFVKKSFLENGVRPEKLLVNPYGAAHIFHPVPAPRADQKFRVLYLGSLILRKGLTYLFEALDLLDIPPEKLEVWFIGQPGDELKPEIARRRGPNRKFWGQMAQHRLPALLAQCDVAVQPSLEEGLSMVIPQMLGCGVPVIATTNTGGADMIREGETGFIVPIRSPEAIAEKIMFLYRNPGQLCEMKTAAAASVRNGFTWDDYGARYVSILKNLS